MSENTHHKRKKSKLYEYYRIYEDCINSKSIPSQAKINIPINNKIEPESHNKLCLISSNTFKNIRNQCRINFQQIRNNIRDRILSQKRKYELNDIKISDIINSSPTKIKENHINICISPSKSNSTINSSNILLLQLKTIVLSNDEEILLSNLQKLIFSNLLDNENLFHDSIIYDTEIIIFFGNILDTVKRNDIILNVLYVLYKLMNASTIYSNCIYSSNMYTKLFPLLYNNSIIITEMSVIILGNLMMDNIELRMLLLTSEHTFDILLSINRSEARIEHIKQVLWICCILCRSKNTPPKMEIFIKIIPIISMALNYNIELAQYALLALSYIVVLGGAYLDIAIERDCIFKTIQWLNHNEKHLEISALHVFVELVAQEEKFIKYAMKLKILDEICLRIDNDEFCVVEASFYIISHLIDTNTKCIQILINLGLIKAIFDVMDKFISKMPDLIAWTICNFYASADPKQAKLYMTKIYIFKISELLSIDVDMVKICSLNTIISILEVAKYVKKMNDVNSHLIKSDAIQLIETYQHHSNSNISLLSKKIIEILHYWKMVQPIK